MRGWLVAILMIVTFSGCAGLGTRPPSRQELTVFNNPILIPITNCDAVWDGTIDVITDYFRIDRQEPVRLLGSTMTEGRIETFPKTGATLFEPWENDSANSYERLESTLQSIRRRAVVRIIPAQGGGFWIDVAIYKELENLPQPEHATVGAATVRYDSSLTRVILPEKETVVNQGWIPVGRDVALEQRILGQLQYRFSPLGQPTPM